MFNFEHKKQFKNKYLNFLKMSDIYNINVELLN